MFQVIHEVYIPMTPMNKQGKSPRILVKASNLHPHFSLHRDSRDKAMIGKENYSQLVLATIEEAITESLRSVLSSRPKIETPS